MFLIASLLVICAICFTQTGAAAIDSTVQNSIEVRVIVDKLAFNKWKQNFTSSTDPDDVRVTQTEQQMRELINAAFVGVNAIFKGLLSYGLNLDARIAEIMFLKNETIPGDVYGNNQVDSDAVLGNFEVWLTGKRFSPVDHTSLFTGWDLSDGSATHVLGVAYLGWMCDSELSISTVELSPSGNMVLTLAHEISHNIGARHDGDTNNCDSDSEMIMDGGRSRNTTDNFIFSSCSVDYIRKGLQYLHDKVGGSCLSATSTTAPAVEGKHIGQLYDPDTICRMNFGTASYFGRTFFGEGGPAGVQPYSGICTAIWCLDKPGSYISLEGTDGFACGDGKMCSLGHCLSSSLAPSPLSNTCPYGNVPNEVSPYGNGQSCSDLVTRYSSWECTSQSGVWSLGRICCGSCEAAVGYTAIPGCEYGDMQVDCYDFIRQHPSACTNYKSTCCYSCGGYINATTSTTAPTTTTRTTTTLSSTTTTTLAIPAITFTSGTTAILVTSTPQTTRPTTPTTTIAAVTTTRPTMTTTKATSTTTKATTTRPSSTTTRPSSTTTASTCVDKSSDCQLYIVSMENHMMCYNSTLARSTCCKSCRQVASNYTGLIGCQYGDPYRGCYYDRTLCSLYYKECCGTCNGH